MFAQKVPKAQSSGKIPQQPVGPGRRLRHGPVEQALFLQGAIGNQATRRLLAQQTSGRPGDAAETTSEAGPGGTPDSVHEVLRSPGRPLDAATRAYFEPRFGSDLSGVRVHTDARAAASAAAVRARAYTVGSNIAFGADEYAPATTQGRELLAHELAHTVQQQRSGGTLSSGANASLEASADAAASVVSQGGCLTAALPAAPVGLARKPIEDDERAKAVAEAEAVAARIDQELADADNDDEAAPKTAAKPKTLARFLPGGFTDQEADAVDQQVESRQKLLMMALDLAERQAKRREFWDGDPSYNTADVTEAFGLDLYWDPKEEGFVRQPYVSQQEAIVDADPEASRLYKDRLWDLTENKPEQKSRFKRVMDAICSHTEPCASNIEQMHRDKEAGMTDAEAINRGMARLFVFAETMALPTEGPSGPIAVDAYGRPIGMPYDVPATEPDVPARAAEQPIESQTDPTKAGSAPVRDPAPPPDPVRPPSDEVVKDPAGPTPPSRPPTGGGGGSPRPSAGATAEGEGPAFRYEHHPHPPAPEVTYGRGSGVRPKASGRPAATRPAPAPAKKGLSGVREGVDAATRGTGTAARSPAAAEELGGPARRPEVDDPDLARTQRLSPEPSLGSNADVARARGLPSEVVDSGNVYTRGDLPETVPESGFKRARPAPAAEPLANERGRGVAGRQPTTAPDPADVQNSTLDADLRLIEDHLATANRGRPPGSRWTLEDVRINRTQSAEGAAGPTRASLNTRPDLQFTIRDPEGNAQRFLIEYDRAPATRSLGHARGILERDPTAIVILKVIGFD